MRVGILADIHGCLPHLETALERFDEARVDQIVVLGDVIDSRRNADETIALLNARDVVGVYGNHELGLCLDPPPSLAQDYTSEVLGFFEDLSSHFALDDLLCSHNLPTQDANDPIAYYLGPKPEERAAIEDCFRDFPHRVMMVGHFHRWFAATASGPLSWDGNTSLSLEEDERYFFVIAAVTDGWSAILDTEEDVLEPISLSS